MSTGHSSRGKDSLVKACSGQLSHLHCWGQTMVHPEDLKKLSGATPHNCIPTSGLHFFYSPPPHFTVCFWSAGYQIPKPPFQGDDSSRPALGRRDWGCLSILGLESGGSPTLSHPPPISFAAFPAGSNPIWSQVNLWHNPAWKCMEILPITIRPREEAVSLVPSSVCCLSAPSLPETTGSYKPTWMAQIDGVGPFL